MQTFLQALPIAFISFYTPQNTEWSSPYYQIVWVTDEGGIQSIFVAPPSYTVHVQQTEHQVVQCLLFQSSYLLSLEPHKKWASSIPIPSTSFSRTIIHMICQLKDDPDSTTHQIRICSFITCLLADILQPVLEDPAPSSKQLPPKKPKTLEYINGRPVIYAVRYMKKHMSNPDLSLQDIANAIGYHPNYFCSEFSRIFSRSPIRFLNELRLNRTLHLLDQTDLSIKCICTLVGVTKPTRLNFMVKSVLGMTPSQFRRYKKQSIAYKGDVS